MKKLMAGMFALVVLVGCGASSDPNSEETQASTDQEVTTCVAYGGSCTVGGTPCCTPYLGHTISCMSSVPAYKHTCQKIP
jgi:cytochrome c biogenesis protein CcdA